MPLETSKTDSGYNYEAKFTAGSLTVIMSAQADPCFRITRFSETMILDGQGVLFERVHSSAGRRVAMNYSFGAMVEGVQDLSLVAEAADFNVYVHGAADGKQIYPLRFPKPVCGCEDAHINSAMMLDAGGGDASPLSIVFPAEFHESLEQLIATVKKEMEQTQFAGPQVENLAWAGCFWATVACQVTGWGCVAACPVSGPGAPLCVSICMAVWAACLAAVIESKNNASFLAPC